MAARRTRLKGNKSPTSTGKRKDCKQTRVVALKDTPKTSTGGTRVSKRTKRLSTPVKSPLQKMKGKRERLPGSADAYEFNETDNFIFGGSFLSSSIYSLSAKKVNTKLTKAVLTENITMKNVIVDVINLQLNKKRKPDHVQQNKKGKPDHIQQNKKGKPDHFQLNKKGKPDHLQQNKKGKPDHLQLNKKGKPDHIQQSKKGKKHNTVKQQSSSVKYSTPLNESLDSTAERQGRCERKASGHLVPLPKLDLDLTVTPILQVSTDSSLKRNRGSSCGSLTVSFGADCKSSPPTTKSSNQAEREMATARQSADTVDPQTGPASVLTRLKRKPSGDRKSVDPCPTPTAFKRPKLPKAKPEEEVKVTKHKSYKQRKVRSPQKSPRSPISANSNKPTADENQGMVDVWEPGQEKMYCTGTLYDSGISLGGSDTSHSTRSATPSALLGFMEAEPLQWQSDNSSAVFDTSPPSPRNPVSTVNKSSDKKYKAGRSKREKGRYSTSRYEAWASSVNQDLQDVESFELFVE